MHLIKSQHASSKGAARQVPDGTMTLTRGHKTPHGGLDVYWIVDVVEERASCVKNKGQGCYPRPPARPIHRTRVAQAETHSVLTY